METEQDVYRKIPAMDRILRIPVLLEAVPVYGRVPVEQAAREVVDSIRNRLRGGTQEDVPDMEEIAHAVLCRLEQEAVPNLRQVINATGVVLHTNLGRAPLAEQARDAVRQAMGYCTLEYAAETGERRSRNQVAEDLLIEVCGCESALVVNNNAAALSLCCCVWGEKGVYVSRGELVEIGDGFRIPEIVEASGGKLVEVGATNRCRASDYARAFCRTPGQGMLLKVHTSNYRIMGFAKDVPVKELAALPDRPVLVADVGSGFLLEPDNLAFSWDEPAVRKTLSEGADCVCFSGDKLLGGPQCGILAGKKEYIDVLRRHPLYRALRPGKLSLAALEGTLRLYRDPDAAKAQVPVLRMLGQSREELTNRGNRFIRCCGERVKADLALLETVCVAGGGSAPLWEVPGAAVAVRPRTMRVEDLHRRLRLGTPCVVARIRDNALLLEMTTVYEEEIERLANALETACSG